MAFFSSSQFLILHIIYTIRAFDGIISIVRLLFSLLLSIAACHTLSTVCDIELWTIQWWKQQKKNPSIFLRNDNCIRRVEKEVPDCQQEHVEEAKKEMNIIYLEVAFKDDGFL